MTGKGLFTDGLENPFQGFKTKEQMALLLLDGSISMGGVESVTNRVKADAVEDAMRELVDPLQNSAIAHEFLVAILAFDHQVDCPLPPTPVRDLDGSDLELDLLGTHGGTTAIGDALERAAELAEEFMADEEPGGAVPRYVVILLMSDGQNNTGSAPRAVAQRIKDRFSQAKPHGPELVIAVAAYGDDADEAMLRDLASNDTYFRRVENGAELRDFFFQTISVSASGNELAV